MGGIDVLIRIFSFFHALLPYYDASLMIANDAMHTITGVIEQVFKLLRGRTQVADSMLAYDETMNRHAPLSLTARSAHNTLKDTWYPDKPLPKFHLV